MTDSPVIISDIGDGKRRRFFLGADELSQIKREAGRGYYTIYTQFLQNAEPDEVRAIIRLALIGGGESPKEAFEIADYYCSPPRPLKDVYLLAFECLSAVWNGHKPKPGGKKLTDAEMDAFFVEMEAALLKAGSDLSVLRGKSFAEVQALLSAMRDESSDAPDAETIAGIKATIKPKAAP